MAVCEEEVGAAEGEGESSGMKNAEACVTCRRFLQGASIGFSCGTLREDLSGMSETYFASMPPVFSAMTLKQSAVAIPVIQPVKAKEAIAAAQRRTL